MSTDYFWIDLGLSPSVALPLEQTREVLSFTLSSVCPIPGTRPELLGVTNQRGNLLWVVDLPRLLSSDGSGLPQPGTLEKVKAVVLAGGNLQAAAIAKGLKGIVSFAAEEIRPHPHPLLQGMAVKAQEDVAILDIEKLFNLFQTGERLTPVAHSF